MTKFAIGRWLRAADDLEPVWPVPASVINELEHQRDGAIAAHMHAEQRAEQAEKKAAQYRDERDGLAGLNLLLCAAATTVEPAGTPIGDQLAAEQHCELCGNWMPADELDGHMNRHDTETAPMTSQAVAS